MTGKVSAVEEQPVRNRFSRELTLEDVIRFEDGKQLVLSHTVRVELIGRFGRDSDDWIGMKIGIATRRIERKGQPSYERFLLWRRQKSAEWLKHGLARPEWVFPSSTGTPLDESKMRKAFNQVLDKAELHRRGPH